MDRKSTAYRLIQLWLYGPIVGLLFALSIFAAPKNIGLAFFVVLMTLGAILGIRYIERRRPARVPNRRELKVIVIFLIIINAWNTLTTTVDGEKHVWSIYFGASAVTTFISLPFLLFLGRNMLGSSFERGTNEEDEPD